MKGSCLAKYAASLASAAILFLALWSCTSPNRTQTPGISAPVTPTGTIREISRQEPGQAYWPTHSWHSATPESQGIDSELLADALVQIYEQGHAIDSLIVVRNGYLVTEAYTHPFQKEERHAIHSCTRAWSQPWLALRSTRVTSRASTSPCWISSRGARLRTWMRKSRQ